MTEQKKSWGGARPGAGRPRVSPPEFTLDQWAFISEALHEVGSADRTGPNPYIEIANEIERWKIERVKWQKERDVLQVRLDSALKELSEND